jgi:hypothetical protein
MEYPRDSQYARLAARNNEAGGTGLIALVVILVITVCTAASLLLSLPETFEGAATAAAMPVDFSTSAAAPTFHEQFRVNGAGESVQPPTF